MPDHITSYSTGPAAAKIGLFLAVIVTFLIVWFGARFQLGDQISEVARVNAADASEAAASATSLSPTNPRAFWLSGAVSRKSFDPQSIEAATAAFTEAAKLGPFHYRWWTELARAREQAGNAEAAEKAYRRAVELAPEYTSPHWLLGNFYLRQGRSDEARTELAAATEHSSLYRGPVYAIAWNFFGNEVRAVEQFANDRPESRSSLALFFAFINRPDDAIRNWNMIDQTQKPAFSDDAALATRMLIKAQSYAGALEFARQAGIDPTARPESITNGDFESAIKERDNQSFDWSAVKQSGALEIAVDGRVKNGGNRSLRLRFRNFTGAWLDSISQTVAVVPGQKYRIDLAYRTEELRGGGLPRVDVLNSADSTYITTGPALSSGTNDWQQMSFEFAAPADLDGIAVKIGREPCAGECPIVGVLWIDDIALSRL